MVTLNVEKSDCRNASELMELYFFQNLKDSLEIGGLDNIDYVRSLLRMIDELNRVANES